MKTNTLQHIIDHWHLGSLERFSVYPGYFRVHTNSGIYLLVEISNREWQSEQTETRIEKFINNKPDTYIRLNNPLYCHVANYHYAAIKVIKN